jgi:hypothetical protein
MELVTFDEAGAARVQNAVVAFERQRRGQVERARSPVIIDGAAPTTSAGWIFFSLAAALAATDASQAGCTVNYYFNGPNPGATVTVYNVAASSNFIFSGAAGKHGIAAWDASANKYWIVQLEC